MTSSIESALLAQASPAGLGLATDLRFVRPAHLRLIDREIVAAIDRARTRTDQRPEILAIEVPPRHGKSTLVSEHTPAWYCGCFPDRRVILASYGADFAGTWGAKARNLLELHGHDLFGVTIDERSKAGQRWRIAGRRGGMITAGVGGRITGEGADLLIVDDPLKNAEEAMSEVIREKQWDWFVSTARSRLEPGAVVIVLMTRWHEADLIGKLLQSAADGGDPVREIRLPALAQAKDPLGRKAGEALWPERYSRAYLEHTRQVLGPYWFAAMYQGRPTPDEGGQFNRRDFRHFEHRDDTVVLRQADGATKSFGADWCQKFQVVDLAASEKETADYTVMLTVLVTPESDLLIDDVVRDRLAVPDQPKFFEAHHAGGPVKFEAIGYQTGMVQTMLRRGFPAEPVYPDKDKVTRAAVAGVLYRAGKVYHRAGAPWLGDLEAELLAFPAGEHDDQVDAIAYAAKALPSLESPSFTPRKGGKTLTGGLMTQEM